MRESPFCLFINLFFNKKRAPKKRISIIETNTTCITKSADALIVPSSGNAHLFDFDTILDFQARPSLRHTLYSKYQEKDRIEFDEILPSIEPTYINNASYKVILYIRSLTYLPTINKISLDEYTKHTYDHLTEYLKTTTTIKSIVVPLIAHGNTMEAKCAALLAADVLSARPDFKEICFLVPPTRRPLYKKSLEAYGRPLSTKKEYQLLQTKFNNDVISHIYLFLGHTTPAI